MTLTGLSTLSGQCADDLSGCKAADRVETESLTKRRCIIILYFSKLNMSCKCRVDCRGKYHTFAWQVFMLFIILFKKLKNHGAA